MDKMIKKILNEPLLHFLLLGAVLFFFLNEPSEAQKSETKELSVEKYEDSLLQGAIVLNLYRHDELVRERLLSKMKQILKAKVSNEEISEEVLHAYYLKNIEDYSEKQSISFYQLYFENKDLENAEKSLEVLEIAAIKPKDAVDFGEKFEKPFFVKEITKNELTSLYGNYFTLKLFTLKKGVWSKPIRSKYGLHLIFISDVKPKKALSFEEVQQRVYDDLKHEDLQNTVKKAYKNMKTQ